MNDKLKQNVLVLGSCRVLVTMNRSNIFECLNTFMDVGKRNLNPKYVIGRGWSILEHLDTVKKLTQNINFYVDRQNFISQEYPIWHNEFYQNLDSIKDIINNIPIFIIEVSSLKYHVDKDGNIIHSIVHSKNQTGVTEKRLSDDEIEQYAIELLNLLSDRKVFFVNHFLHSKIPERLKINNVLTKLTQKYDNCFLITPSNLWNEETKYLFITRGENHYVDDKIDTIKNYIESFMLSVL